MQILYTKALSLVDSKFTEQQKEGAFSGYAAATGNVDLGSDIILKGAFSDWLKTADASRVRVLWNHDWDRPIGKNMAMSEDDRGLLVDGELLLDIKKAQETRTLIQNNAIDGLSIGYRVDDFSYDNNVRVIKKLSVLEYSFVTFAMNPNAIVNDMKSAKLDTVRDCEHYLRDVCKLSRSEAKTLISRIKQSRDDEPNYDEIAASLLKLNQTLRG
ncbi:MAG TPA: HK97 family phage prohead protease [Agitococcus sp.]|nr:HK97 family phage prohead protease [Agitococcus sp.]